MRTPADIHAQWIDDTMADRTDEHRERMADILGWVAESYPELTPVVKWNQPMFTLDKPFIIGFSVAKPHVAVAPEREPLAKFGERIDDIGYSRGKAFFRIPFAKTVDYGLLADIIDSNIADRRGSESFWR